MVLAMKQKFVFNQLRLLTFLAKSKMIEFCHKYYPLLSRRLIVEEKTLSRRSFFKFAAAAVAVVPFLANATKAFAADACPATAPAGKPLASPTEGMGKTLQYVTDAKTTKNPKYKAGSKCGGCNFYNDKKAEGGYAPCTMMGMKYVTNCGWCTSFKAKA